MPNVPLREGIIVALDKRRKETTEKTGVHVTYSDVVLDLLEKER